MNRGPRKEDANVRTPRQDLVLQSHLACEMTSRAHSLVGDVNRH